ncbi:MAG: CoA-binding protein [Bacteroidales bacterium]|jgi:predicted CoA-binding protein|nr:CoA-binding protein [Bacteroidales bacterium]
MKDVARFLSLEKYAIAGVSRDPKKFGHVMFKDLRKKGMDAVPVNPNAESIDGVKCYSSVKELPADIRGVIFMTPKEETAAVAREAIDHGIKDLWIQQGAETKAIVEELSKEDVNLIHNQCILMFWKPNGVHSVHRFLKKIFGGLPA